MRMSLGFYFMLILAFAVLSLDAGPIMIQRVNSPDHPSSTSEQHHAYKNKQDYVVKQADVIQHPKQPSDNLKFNPYHLFRIYDKRGPWTPSFLPQPPPTPAK